VAALQAIGSAHPICSLCDTVNREASNDFSEFVDYSKLSFILPIAGSALALWSYCRAQRRRCPECGATNQLSSFCTRCGAPQKAGERSGRADLLNKPRILRTSLLIALSYCAGIIVLLAVGLFFEPARSLAMRTLLLAYIVVGLFTTIAVYAWNSRCPVCRHFVPLDFDRNYSANYCGRCGNKVAE
jgi:hypothetical protein